MKKIIIFLFIGVMAGFFVSCEKLLDQTPKGVISSDELNTPERVEQLINAAYSFIGTNHYNKQMGEPYEEGSVRGGECYKGGSGTNDNAERNLWETFTYMTPTTTNTLDNLWWVHYVAVGRINDALRRVEKLDESVYPKKIEREAELRFLRGHVYFYMKECFKFFPYIDENTPLDEYGKINNDSLTSQELWGKIAGDFKFAADNLPPTQDEIARPTKWAAKAYLAKTLLFSAYVQDEKNNVTSINKEDLQKVADLCKEVMDKSGKGLYDEFSKNFLPEYENGKESIWAVQYTASSPTGRPNSWLICPMVEDYGCCGFFQPSVNMMNSFKTVKGLPDFNNYNSGTPLTTKKAFSTHTMDPRLLHSAVVPGMPWKYDPTYIMEKNWARSPEVYGYSMSQKMIVLPTSPYFVKTLPFMGAALNWDVIRYDEVMLWRAEALIKLGGQANLDEALNLINQIRERAAQSTKRLKWADGTPTGDFNVQPYKPGINCPAWTQEFAFKALRWERRLEFATEGKRFFSLVRWGIAAEVLNSYFEVEKVRKSYLKNAHFTKNRDEYFPIPQTQIEYVHGLYKQNYGY